VIILQSNCIHTVTVHNLKSHAEFFLSKKAHIVASFRNSAKYYISWHTA